MSGPRNRSVPTRVEASTRIDFWQSMLRVDAFGVFMSGEGFAGELYVVWWPNREHRVALLVGCRGLRVDGRGRGAVSSRRSRDGHGGEDGVSRRRPLAGESWRPSLDGELREPVAVPAVLFSVAYAGSVLPFLSRRPGAHHLAGGTGGVSPSPIELSSEGDRFLMAALGDHRTRHSDVVGVGPPGTLEPSLRHTDP